MQREGDFREMKLRRCHEKNSEKKARRKAEAIRRARKQMRKRLDIEGFQRSFNEIEYLAADYRRGIFFMEKY